MYVLVLFNLGAKGNFQNIDQFQDDADVISFVGRAQSVTSERTESDYCHMRTRKNDIECDVK